jgi:hypothetical protein
VLIVSFVALFVLVAIITVTTIVGVYARSGYFLSTNDDNVITIYRGRAGGVWWFHPTVELESDLQLTEVPTGIVRDVRDNITFDSLSDAQQYLEFVATAVTTTTTTVPPTDTTTPPTSTTGG